MFDAPRLIPMMIMAAGATKGTQALQPLINQTKIVATQTEVNEISKMLVLDMIEGKPPAPENFGAYLREHMRAPEEAKRDLAKDIFGGEYRYDITNNMLRVTSPGPDVALGTADDIYVTRKL